MAIESSTGYMRMDINKRTKRNQSSLCGGMRCQIGNNARRRNGCCMHGAASAGGPEPIIWSLCLRMIRQSSFLSHRTKVNSPAASPAVSAGLAAGSDAVAGAADSAWASVAGLAAPAGVSVTSRVGGASETPCPSGWVSSAGLSVAVGSHG